MWVKTNQTGKRVDRLVNLEEGFRLDMHLALRNLMVTYPNLLLYEASATDAGGATRTSQDIAEELQKVVGYIEWCFAGDKTVEATRPALCDLTDILSKPFTFTPASSSGDDDDSDDSDAEDSAVVAVVAVVAFTVPCIAHVPVVQGDT